MSSNLILHPKSPNIEDRVISSSELSDDEEVVVLVGDLLSLPAALEGPAHLVADHLVVPVGQHVPGEPGGELHHAHPEVGVVDVQVVGHAPHQDQVDALLLQLPGDAAGGASEAGDGENDNIHAGDNEEEGRRTQEEDRGKTKGRRGEQGRTHSVRGG